MGLSRVIAFLLALLAASSASFADDVDFNRDVRPILAGRCFKCHGPDDSQRQAGMRLDSQEGSRTEADSGLSPIVPGKPEESELVRRITSEDAAEVMPPPEVKNPLGPREIEILTAWIRQGAPYDPHWAFVPPVRRALPHVNDATWVRNPIDRFILARLEAAGLEPQPPADPYALVRRVYLDLLGYPPTPEEADRFISDPSPDAYERLVDRLLANPHYGERWARRWLDLARYADTNGYEKDRPRSIWPYRDWVIKAHNDDLPFDRFTEDQIAGDLLPEATLADRVATGFHRNTMINEEGGIDPLEFRFHAMTDRVATTATVFLGMTMGCAQCHSHKFDPLSQREYYQFMAFLNNAEEPTIDVPSADLAARRAAGEQKIAELERTLIDRFPTAGEIEWHPLTPVRVESAGKATAEITGDGSVCLSGENPERDTLTVVLESDLEEVSLLRLEALADPALPSMGPGRTPHGNFVLSELTAAVAPRDEPDKSTILSFSRAEADFSQDGFPVAHAFDGSTTTGWAIHGPDPWNVNRTATFWLSTPAGAAGSAWTVRLDQQHGTHHTLGRFRLSLGRDRPDPRPIEVRRRENLDRCFGEWLAREAPKAVRWDVLLPAEARANMARLDVLDDGSILASGDISKRDVYDLSFAGDLRGVTAIRLEALPDESLPARGPGRVYYEGPFGDFFLSEITAASAGKPVPLVRGSHSRANGGNTAAAAVDGNPLTGWSINGSQGKTSTAVFHLERPAEEGRLDLQFVFERYYAAPLGRLRISVAREAQEAEARGLPADVEGLLCELNHEHLAQAQSASREAGGPAGEGPPPRWDLENGSRRDRLMSHFLSVAPELEGEREAIDRLRRQLPPYPTTLVMRERPPAIPRPTFIHKRGEFLQPTDEVSPGVPDVLHDWPADWPRDRLHFARWLVDPSNPLAGRVVVNRQWSAIFGRGLVRTVEDFGYQGEPPTHPDLLDWLAVETVQRGWSMKALHRLIVTSTAYRQGSNVGAEAAERDPDNRLLSHMPRVRLDGELLRDSALRAAGLLSETLGGPSVFPPQPANVTTEGAYGALEWKVSAGGDRYRRGLYTYAKRTTPYAMFTTFDAPTGESCVARREASNTSLQALTRLNDPVFVEAAQVLGGQAARLDAASAERARLVFRRILTRPPTEEEVGLIVAFHDREAARLRNDSARAEQLAGPGEGDPIERAAWTAVARALLNVDEAVTK
jgi:hypothetical protein